ncbi:MAG TPA: helix-hairpin-helix domain-containing protein [Methylophilaceae bacterium]|nr:helix-hairpin-helix domain-containing protein [Methylophilaceae bacterium]
MKKTLLVLFAALALCLGSLSAFAATDLNTASAAELQKVKGIGPKKAEAIIEYRKKTPFKSVDDLDKVPGFGKATVDKVRKDVTVGSSGSTKPAKTPAAK